tara:strand:- start:21870 stop:23864 length:1995 start_codon:yes stop_codon:yes gene_type:complete
LATALLASPAAAQEDIVVAGTPLQEAAGADAYATVLVPRAALTASPSGQLENALEQVPGFQLFRRADSRSSNATSQGATLRGIGGNATGRTLVLLDGVPIADPFAGYIPWAGIPPESLALARVTTGGGAGPFGAGALSGTIELISAGPGARSSALRARYGSRDSIDLGAALVERVGNGFVALDASHAEGDGYFTTAPEDRGAVDTRAPYEQQNISARAVFPVGNVSELQVRGAWFRDDRQNGQALVTSGMEGADSSVRLLSRGALPFEVLAYVQARDYRATFARTEADRSAEQPALQQAVPATGIGAKAELRPTFGAHELRLGTDWRHTAGETKERFNFDGTRLASGRTAGGRSNTVGLFVEDSWQTTEDLTLTAGARVDRWWLDDGRLVEEGAVTSFGDRSGWEPTGRLAAAYDATPALKLRAAGYVGWRLPTLNELYRPFRVGPDATAANAALRPEESRGVEAGFDYQPLSTARLSVTGFVVRAKDMISNITLGEGPGVFPGSGFVFGSYRQRLNLDAVDSRGIEASAQAEIGRLTLTASYAFTDAEQKGSGPTAAQDGFRPPQIPEHSAFAGARVGLGESGSVGASLRYVGPQFEDDLEQRPLDDFVQLDASAVLPVARGVALTLAGENLTDSRIEDGIDARGALSLAQPRTLWVGIRWQR